MEVGKKSKRQKRQKQRMDTTFASGETAIVHGLTSKSKKKLNKQRVEIDRWSKTKQRYYCILYFGGRVKIKVSNLKQESSCYGTSEEEENTNNESSDHQFGDYSEGSEDDEFPSWQREVGKHKPNLAEYTHRDLRNSASSYNYGRRDIIKGQCACCGIEGVEVNWCMWKKCYINSINEDGSPAILPDTSSAHNEHVGITLHACNSCHAFHYCSLECQRQHHQQKGQFTCQHLRQCLKHAETTEYAVRMHPNSVPDGQWGQLDCDYTHLGHTYFQAQYNAIRLLLSNAWQSSNQFAKPRLLTSALGVAKRYLDNDRRELLSMEYPPDQYRAMNGLVPRLMLELGRNQEAYDFVKWWILHSEAFIDVYGADEFIMFEMSEEHGAESAGCKLNFLSLRNEPMDEVFVPYHEGIQGFLSRFIDGGGHTHTVKARRAKRRRHEFFPLEASPQRRSQSNKKLNFFEISLDHAVAIAMIKHRALVQARVPYEMRFILAMGHSLRRSESVLRNLPNEIVREISHFAFGIKAPKTLNVLRNETYTWFLRVHCLNREIWPCVVQPRRNMYNGNACTLSWSSMRDGDKFKGLGREINQWIRMWRKEPFSVQVLRDWFQTTPVGGEWIPSPKCSRCGIFVPNCCIIPDVCDDKGAQFEFCFACGPGTQNEINGLILSRKSTRDAFSHGSGKKISMFDADKWYKEHEFAHRSALEKRTENEHLLQQMLSQIRSKIAAEKAAAEKAAAEKTVPSLQQSFRQRFIRLIRMQFHFEQDQSGEWNYSKGLVTDKNTTRSKYSPRIPKSEDPLANDMRQIFLMLQNVTNEYLSKASPEMLIPKRLSHIDRERKVLFPRSSVENEWITHVQRSDMKGIRVVEKSSRSWY